MCVCWQNRLMTILIYIAPHRECAAVRGNYLIAAMCPDGEYAKIHIPIFVAVPVQNVDNASYIDIGICGINTNVYFLYSGYGQRFPN